MIDRSRLLCCQACVHKLPAAIASACPPAASVCRRLLWTANSRDWAQTPCVHSRPDLSLPAGFFEACAAPHCLFSMSQTKPLPLTTLVFCAVEGISAMKVLRHF